MGGRGEERDTNRRVGRETRRAGRRARRERAYTFNEDREAAHTPSSHKRRRHAKKKEKKSQSRGEKNDNTREATPSPRRPTPRRSPRASPTLRREDADIKPEAAKGKAKAGERGGGRERDDQRRGRGGVKRSACRARLCRQRHGEGAGPCFVAHPCHAAGQAPPASRPPLPSQLSRTEQQRKKQKEHVR